MWASGERGGGVVDAPLLNSCCTPKHGESLTSDSKNPLPEALVHWAFPLGFFRMPALQDKGTSDPL